MIERKISKLISYLSLIIAFIVVVWGFIIIDSPAHNRKKSLDKNKIEDLRSIKYEIEGYFKKHKEVPSSFEKLAQDNNYYSRKNIYKDDITNKFYKYKVIDPGSFKLCAEFELTSENFNTKREIDFWKHDAGLYCFEINLLSTKNNYPRY